MKVTANYHGHTYRCGHAYGQDEEYVQAALEMGFEVMGFADHVILPGFAQYPMRADYDKLPDYLSSIDALKKKYEGKIEIYKGFEAEWLGAFYEDYYRDLLKSGKVDYLILGQHGEMPRQGEFFFFPASQEPKEAILRYADLIVEGARTGLFSYICHPDVFVNWFHYYGEEGAIAARKIAEVAKEMGIPLEVNITCTRMQGFAFENEDLPFYPFPSFWDIVSEVGCDVIIGVDAHHPDHYRSPYFDEFVAFCERHHLHRLDRLTFRKGK